MQAYFKRRAQRNREGAEITIRFIVEFLESAQRISRSPYMKFQRSGREIGDKTMRIDKVAVGTCGTI